MTYVMYDWNDGSSWGAWLAMGFMMVLFWGFIAAIVVFLVRSSAPRPDDRLTRDSPAESSALRILHERFARGEIDTEEYTKRRDLLRPP